MSGARICPQYQNPPPQTSPPRFESLSVFVSQFVENFVPVGAGEEVSEQLFGETGRVATVHAGSTPSHILAWAWREAFRASHPLAVTSK